MNYYDYMYSVQLFLTFKLLVYLFKTTKKKVFYINQINIFKATN